MARGGNKRLSAEEQELTALYAKLLNVRRRRVRQKKVEELRFSDCVSTYSPTPIVASQPATRLRRHAPLGWQRNLV